VNILAAIDFESIFELFKKGKWVLGGLALLAFLIVIVGKKWFDKAVEHFGYQIKQRIWKKRFVKDLTSEIFGEGKVELLTQARLKEKASKERIFGFYNATKLDWDIIAANGDIPRDQYSELKAMVGRPRAVVRLVCVVAEAGAGKSTLAWRVAADLFRENKDSLVLHIRDPANEQAEVWQLMVDFQRKLNRPLIVLVDDIFRDPEASNAFIGLPTHLPLTIIATSRRNEFRLRAKRLKCECVQMELNPPSPKEKESILKTLGKSRATLTVDQKRRLDNANQFIVLAMACEPQSGSDCRLLRHLCYERKREKDALGPIAKWIANHPKESGAHISYFGLVEKYARDNIPDVIQETDRWLDAHPTDNDVRPAFLIFVEKNRNEKVAFYIKKVEKWLEQHSEDSYVRAAYLGVVGRNGTYKQIEDVILNTSRWLKKPENKGDIDARKALLGLLRRRWLYERLLKEHPEHKLTKIHHAAWLRDKGNPVEAEKYYKQLITEDPNQFGPRVGLGQLYLNLERFPEAAEQFVCVLRARGGVKHQIAHEGLGQALWKTGELSEAEKEIKLAIQWADNKGQSTARFYTLLGRLYLDWNKPRPRWVDAIKAFETAQDEDPDYYGNYWGIGRALFGLGKFEEASDALRRTFELKPDLGPPASDEINALLDQCQLKAKPDKQPTSILQH
jgi:tetratricopeptide (TPR) repeat protein